MKIAVGLLAPDSGSVHFAGEAYESVRLPRLARRGLFYLPDHDVLSRTFTVRHQLEMIRMQFRGGNVVEAAERVGIAERLDQRARTLSGGELRRAELAAILVRRPLCVLADEPCRGLAPKDAESVMSIFADLAHAGTAVVVSGHEVHTLLAAVDHVSWCTSGTTYELGSPSMATSHDAFRREYLGPRGVA